MRGTFWAGRISAWLCLQNHIQTLLISSSYSVLLRDLGTRSLRHCSYTDSRHAVLHYCCSSPASGHVSRHPYTWGCHHVWHDSFCRPGTCNWTEVWQLIPPCLPVSPAQASTRTCIFQAPLINITLNV